MANKANINETQMLLNYGELNAKMRFGKTLYALLLAREMGEWEGNALVKRTLI